MVKEKEAFIINMMKVVDVTIIIISFILSYFIDDLFRSVYNFDEMAYAIAPTLEGLYFFSKMNWPLTLSIVPVWLSLLSALGDYRDFRTRRFKKELIIIIRTAILSIVVFGSIFFILQMKFTSRLYIGIFTVTLCFVSLSKNGLFHHCSIEFTKAALIKLTC